ncbi:Vegetative incompatibility protein HET-E-1 [Fusarium oxysporum f. sp. albedinis]|nr:Vegetative incompatibility protein HET-E-1 [Fusarium oxysporum f. sp. albedinis]
MFFTFMIRYGAKHVFLASIKSKLFGPFCGALTTLGVVANESRTSAFTIAGYVITIGTDHEASVAFFAERFWRPSKDGQIYVDA